VSTHTPGPWSLNGTAIEGEDEWIASVDPENDETEHGSANAQLLLAAPDLLKALQDIVTYCDCAPPTGDKRILYELYQAAKAAIAKAVGE
jgi:hypothetical protein